MTVWRGGLVDSFNLDSLTVHSASHCEKIAAAPGNFGKWKFSAPPPSYWIRISGWEAENHLLGYDLRGGDVCTAFCNRGLLMNKSQKCPAWTSWASFMRLFLKLHVQRCLIFGVFIPLHPLPTCAWPHVDLLTFICVLVYLRIKKKKIVTSFYSILAVMWLFKSLQF